MEPLAKAVEFLSRRAAEAAPGHRLAPIRQLAAEAGVSHHAMSRAVRLLTSRGLLRARPRSGIVVVQPFPEGTSAATSHVPTPGRLVPRWQRVASAVAQRLRTAGHSSTADVVLPKALCAEFGVSYPTARKALDYLADHDLLRPYSRGFVPVGAEGYSGLAVLCVTRRPRDFAAVSQWRTPRQFASEFEQVCAVEHVPLQYVFPQYDGARLRGLGEARRLLGHLVQNYARAMVVVSSAGMSDTSALGACEYLHDIPVPMVLVSFSHETPSVPRPFSRLGIVHAGQSRRAGVLMADFLAARNYSRITLVGHADAPGWQDQRLNGLRTRLAERRPSVHLHTCLVERPDAPAYDGPVMPSPRSRPRTRMQYRRILSQLESEHERARDLYLLQTAVDGVIGAVRSSKPDVVVGANDDLAVACMDSLAAQGVEVPRDCAVVGIDDSPLAFAAYLTSYSHNWHGVAREILRFGLTCPEHSVAPSALDVDGSVVERLSTASR